MIFIGNKREDLTLASHTLEDQCGENCNEKDKGAI
jgi:hypothetical protein